MTTPSDRPVFVDPSGRRRKVLRIAIGTVAAGVLAYLVLLVVALAGGPMSPATLLPIPKAEPAVTTTTTDAPASSPEATSLPRNETTTVSTTTSTAPPVTKTTTTTTTTSENGNKHADPPGASNRPSNPGQGKP
jgi:cytoskeletal protein RodZ